jgi:hypothetical protein
MYEIRGKSRHPNHGMDEFSRRASGMHEPRLRMDRSRRPAVMVTAAAPRGIRQEG